MSWRTGLRAREGDKGRWNYATGGRTLQPPPRPVPRISIKRWQVCNSVLKAKLCCKRDAGKIRKEMPHVLGLAFEQHFFSVVFWCCEFYVLPMVPSPALWALAIGMSCWPISPLLAARLLVFAQGRSLVQHQTEPCVLGSPRSHAGTSKGHSEGLRWGDGSSSRQCHCGGF